MSGNLVRTGMACDERPDGSRMPTQEQNLLSIGAAVFIGTLIAFYMISQFMRNSVGVIAPDLAVDLHLSAADIGLLSSAFFFAFAAVQLPLGIALDRFGPRTVLLVCAGITVAGAILFAVATSAAGLIVARILMGIGCSSSLMAPLALYAKRFPPERFATLTGLQLGLGTIGTLFATAPLAYATAGIGWRATFLVVGGLTLLGGLLVAIVVRDDGLAGASAPRRETFRESVAGLAAVLRTPSVGRLFLMHWTGYATFVLLVGLWGAPYLTDVYGYDLKARGNLLLLPVIAQIIGSLLWGPMDRALGSYKLPVLVGAALTTVTLFVLALVGTLPFVPLLAWLVAFGFLSAYTPVMMAHGKSLFPPHLVGRGITLLNMGTMAGVFFSQALTGLIIDLFPAAAEGAYPLDAFRAVFALQSAFLLVSCLVYIRSRDPWAGAG
jgi:MFS family permease